MASQERRTVMTVTGPIPVDALGRTLMHEHLLVGAPGWEFDIGAGPSFGEMVERCVDRIEELKSAGYASLVDPCPIDMARDVNLMREVSSRAGFHIVCATGFYHGEIGAASHWRFRAMLDPDTPKRIAELLIKEITEGVGETGVRAGIIKTATGHLVTPYETMMLAATAQASLATNTPITTHTEGVHGDLQLDNLCGAGVGAADVVVGHTCGSKDPVYQRALAERGAFVGFDRFGFAPANTDENRADALVALVRAGFGHRIVVSHDCVLCYRGVDHLRPERRDFMLFERTISPMLRERGLTAEEVERLLVDNPRRFFQGAYSP
jgi:phosphotriesterase-related protein